MAMNTRSNTTLLGLLIAIFTLTGLTNGCSTAMDYEVRCKECVSNLARSWKAHPKANCSVQYLSLKKCLTNTKDKCLNSPSVDSHTRRMIQQRFTVYKANEEFFCKNGMFDSMANYKPSALPMCSPKLFRKALKCARRFQARFSKNRGSKKMCRWFCKARQCMLKAVKRNCKASRMTSALIAKYGKPYNPYCKGSKDNVKIRVKKGSQGFGRCTQKSYVIKSRECIAQFIRRLQKNNGQQCRAIVSDVLLPCVKSRMKRCLRGTRDAKSLDDAISSSMKRKLSHTQNKYCEGSHLETLPLSREQCSQEYFENFQGRCNAKFVALYRENRANPTLCQHYAEVKRCARNMTLSMCTLENSMKDAVLFIYGDFNPFCPDARDPPITPGLHPKPERHNLSLENSGMAHAGSVLTLVTSIVAFILAST